MRLRLIVPALALAIGMRQASSQTSSQTPAKPGPVAKGPKLPTSSIGVEVVYVTQFHSVQPKSIVRAAGPFLLVIENRTMRPVLNLSVKATGPTATAVAADVLKGQSLEFALDLPVGHYKIAEASKADWTIDLEIRNK